MQTFIYRFEQKTLPRMQWSVCVNVQLKPYMNESKSIIRAK